MVEIAASMLAADSARLGEQAKFAQDAGADFLHLDVMDGMFVPNISFGAGVVAAMRKACALPLDVHLMIEEPARFIPQFVEAGADYLTVHAEAGRHLQRTLQSIRALGAKAGVALNPDTPLEALDYVLDDADLILIMTVNPGFGGQKLIPATVEKVRKAAGRIKSCGRDIVLEVDGGVQMATAPGLAAAGAHLLVAGSAFFGSPDPAAFIRQMKEACAPCGKC